MLITAIVFVNLLIAKFNDTYVETQTNANNNFHANQLHYLEAYLKYHPVPAPLNVVTLPIEMLLTLAKSCYVRDQVLLTFA